MKLIDLIAEYLTEAHGGVGLVNFANRCACKPHDDPSASADCYNKDCQAIIQTMDIDIDASIKIFGGDGLVNHGCRCHVGDMAPCFPDGIGACKITAGNRVME